MIVESDTHYGSKYSGKYYQYYTQNKQWKWN